MKYSEIINVEKHFKSAFDITSDRGEAWKTFISNERFEGNLSQIINCFTSPVLNNRKSMGQGRAIPCLLSNICFVMIILI